MAGGGPAPALQEYQALQDSLQGRDITAEEYLYLYSKAKEAGLPREAQLHLLRAGHLAPQDPRVAALLRTELTPDEFAGWQIEHRQEKPFWRDLRSVVRYPAQRDGLIMLSFAAAGLSLGRVLEDLGHFLPVVRFVLSVPIFMVSGLAGAAIVVLLPGFLNSIALRTARGKDDFPDWPSFSDLFTNMVFPSLKCLAIVIWSFLPLELYLWTAIRNRLTPSAPLLALLAIAGLLFFPMSFLMMVITGRLWAAMLPSNTIEAIAKSLKDYLRLCPLFWLLLLLPAASAVLWRVPILGAPAVMFLTLYCWAAAMHLLGRFYRLEEKKLGWI